MRAILMVWAILCLYHPSLHAQEPGDSLTKLPVGFLSSIHKQVSSVDTKIGRENQKALRKWERQERQLLRKLSRVDSASAAQLRTSFIKKDQQLKTVLANPSLATRQYLPSLDTLNSSLKFLTDNPSLLSDKLASASDLLKTGSLDKLTRNLGQSEKISALMQEKQALLREKLGALGLGRHLKSLNKTAYSMQFIMQKINYIHQNPVVAGLVNRAEDYRLSSAIDFAKGRHCGLLEVDLLLSNLKKHESNS